MILDQYKHSTYDYLHTMNKLSFPITRFTWEEYQQFNEVYLWAKENCIEGRLTKSGGIAGGPYNRGHNFYGIIYKEYKSIELILCHGKYGCFRFIVSNKRNKANTEMTGSKALRTVYKLAKDFGVSDVFVNHRALTKEQGLEIKKEIESPRIEVLSESFKGREFDHAYHIDLNSSYFSRICEAVKWARLKPLGKYLYDHRKENDGLYKAVMTNAIGCMQSEFCEDVTGEKWRAPYQLAEFAKQAVNGTNRLIKALVDHLNKCGFEPLLINTDGIWYVDRSPQNRKYVNPYFPESMEFGRWKHDHKDVKLYIKSAGAYQYIEDGQVKTVLRGTCKLDFIKPDRDTWGWKEIRDQVPYIYRFNKERGVLKTYV